MAEETRRYRRLPGPLLSPTRVWLGEDHLLVQIRSSWTHIERYRRFYLRDIQAFIIRRTAEGKAWSIVLGGGIVLMLLIGAATGDLHLVLLLFCSLLLVVLLVNLGLGPTCQFHIRTAVNLQRLPMLSRLATAERFLAIVVPLVNEAQGRMSAEEVRERAVGLPAAPDAPPGATWAGAAGFPRPIRHYDGAMHGVLFALLLAGCGLSLLDYLHHTSAAAVLVGMMLLGQFVIAIITAVKQGGTDISGGMKATVWLTIAYLCVVYLLALGAPFAELDPARDTEPATPFAMTPFALFIAVCSGAAGLIGFVQLALFRGEYGRRRAAAGLSSTPSAQTEGSSQEPEPPVPLERT